MLRERGWPKSQDATRHVSAPSILKLRELDRNVDDDREELEPPLQINFCPPKARGLQTGVRFEAQYELV